MPGWDIDEEENLGFGEKKEGEVVGKEDYMIVIHFPGLVIKQFIPMHAEKDENGKIIMNPFQKNIPKLEEGDPTSVYQKLTVNWKSPKPVLDKLQTEYKTLCNSLKAFLNKHKVAVFYHNSNRDECAKYKGSHLHIVYHSEQTATGQFQAIWQRSEWITLQKKAKASGGYCRCLGVKKLEGALRHFNEKPRLYLGTNYTPYGKIVRKCQSNDIPPTPWDQILEEENEDPEVDSTCDFGDFDDVPIARKLKRCADDFDAEMNEPNFKLQKSATGPVNVKETEKDAQVRLISMLCNRWDAWSVNELFRRSALATDIESEQRYVKLWYTLSTKTTIKAVIKNARQRVESLIMMKPFATLINDYCTQVYEIYDGVENRMTPEESYEKMIAWLKYQNLDPIAFVDNVCDIMDKVRQKVNTICLIGDSNSGKSTMVSQPLRILSRHVGLIGNKGANSDFVYQECVNKRAIIIDECVMNPVNLEELKKLTGGEEMKVNVKQEEYATIVRTPVIMTGNKEPWCLDSTQEDPFRNRMVYYEVTKCEELEHVGLISPKMWWYLIQMRMSRVAEPDTKNLIPVPVVENAETSDEDLN